MKASLIFLIFLLSGCYSFKGIDIPDNINTFIIIPFENRAANVVPTLAVSFTEALKDKIRRESRLNYTNVEADADIIINGAIVDYTITPVAPKPNETTALNQVRLAIGIDFENTKDEKKSWKQNFSYITNFPSNVNLLSIQDELLEDINVQLTEDIFNKAFTDW